MGLVNLTAIDWGTFPTNQHVAVIDRMMTNEAYPFGRVI